MGRTAFECAFSAIQVRPGQRLTPLHRTIMRALERREQYRKDRKSNKGR
jgi:hypothetical protein